MAEQQRVLSYLPLLTKLMEAGHRLDKYTAASSLRCCERTAQRLLCHLHVGHHIYIAHWLRGKGGALPVYAWGFDMPDAVKPKALTATEKSRMRRTDPERLVKEATNARNRRMAVKRLGVFGI